MSYYDTKYYAVLWYHPITQYSITVPNITHWLVASLFILTPVEVLPASDYVGDVVYCCRVLLRHFNLSKIKFFRHIS